MRSRISIVILGMFLIGTLSALVAQSNASAQQKGCPIDTDWRKALESTEALAEPYCAKLAQALKQSVVPTEREAISRAFAIARDIDGWNSALMGFKVTALIRLALDSQELGPAGSFVWEIRFTTQQAVVGSTLGVVWIGAQTGKTKVLR